MKVAIALSGLPRLSNVTSASWGRIIGKFNADVFIHTWCQSPEIDQIVYDQLNLMFNPKIIRIDPLLNIDVSPYPNRHWPCIDVYRSLSMWNSIKFAHNMILEYSSYDIIIRGRLDWYVKNLEIITYDSLVLPYDTDKFVLQFDYKGQKVYGYNDAFAYGNVDNMSKYVNTLDLIYDLYTNEGVDYCPENFLTASLIRQNVPLILQKMEQKLIRG